MAGLLDFLTTDEAQLGLGLLAAGGPSPVPMSFGQRIAAGVGQAQAAKDGRLRNKLLESQIAENMSQEEYRRATAQTEARKLAAREEWMRRFQGDGSGANSIQNMTADDVAAARLAGLPDMTQLWQATRPEMVEVAPGMWADKKTIQPGVNQQALAQRSRDRMEQSDIGMRGEFVDVEDAEGRKWKVPKTSLVGGAPPSPAAVLPGPPLGAPRAPVSPAPSATGPGYAGGSSNAAAVGQAEVLNMELQKAWQAFQIAQKAGDAPAAARAQQDGIAIERELARLPGVGRTPPSPLIGAVPPVAGAIPSGMSRAQTDAADIQKAGELKRQQTQIEADAKAKELAPKQAASRADSIQKAERLMTTVDEALKTVGVTTSGAGGSVLRAVPGTSARDLSGTLETIKANLGFAELQAMRDASPTGGALGAIAVQELAALQSTVASLDQTQSPTQLAANLSKIKEHYGRWRSTLEGAQREAGGAVPQKKAQSFDALPPPAQFKGRTIRDTTTGSRLVSDGLTWKPAE